MSYNRTDYIKIRKQFEDKYLAARSTADARRDEIHLLIPEVKKIDDLLSHTGMDIMAVITSGTKNTSAEIAKLEARNNGLLKKRGELLRAGGYPEDYTDVHYECERCGDTGFLNTSMCDCMKKALVKEAYSSSGLGALIGTQTFDNFDYRYYGEEIRNKVKGYVSMLKSFSEGFSDKTYENYIMIGSTGLGKTHLSTAAAQVVIERGYDVLYVGAVSMLGDFEAERFGNGAHRKNNDVDRYYESDLLIIDDLGTEIINKFTNSYLYDVINTRINNKRCTVINTNLMPSEILSVYSERISSRILGEYTPMYFKGVDIRKQKG